MGIPAFLFDPALHRNDPSFGRPDEADSDAGKSPSEGTEKLSDGKTGSLAPKHTGNWLLSAVTLVAK